MVALKNYLSGASLLRREMFDSFVIFKNHFFNPLNFCKYLTKHKISDKVIVVDSRMIGKKIIYDCFCSGWESQFEVDLSQD
jgi:hypothetical protein